MTTARTQAQEGEEVNSPTWKLTLARYDDGEQPAEELTVRGDHLGELLGEAMHSGVRWEGDDGEGPMNVLADLFEVMTQVHVTFEDEQLRDLNQVLRRFADGGEREPEDLRAAMAAVAREANP